MQRSFQGRVAVLLMLWTGIIFFGCASAAWLLIRSHIITASDQILIGWKLRAAAQLEPWPGLKAFTATLPASPLQLRSGTLPVCITNLRGEILYKTPTADWLASYAASDFLPQTEDLAPFEGEIRIQSKNVQSALFTVARGEQKIPHRILRLNNNKINVLTGINMSEFNAGLLALQQYFLIGLIAGLLLVLLGSWLTARRALLPLRRIQLATASIDGSADLSGRIPTGKRDYVEFAALVESLNGMMQRLEDNFQRATRFTADASHELKTPIALLQNAVNKGLKTAVPGSTDETQFIEIASEISRFKKILEALLLLSAADAGRLSLRLKRFDFTNELESLCEDAGLLADEASISFESRIDDGLITTADQILILQAIQNLVSNAIKYNRPEGRVELTCQKQGDQIVIEVENTGPEIPAGQRRAIFDRFHRVARARADEPGGSGLGLNLAREIAKAHSGDLQLVCGDEDSIRFRLTLPIEA